MNNIDFRTKDWEDAQKILDFFRMETTCMDTYGRLLIKPQFVVAIGNDMVSAFYAATIMEQAKKQFGTYPKLLCVGGTGMLSKYLNQLDDGTILSEGMNLRMTALKFGNFPAAVLDSGNNIYANVKEIIEYLSFYHMNGEPIVFCLTQRLSKLVERTVEFMTKQISAAETLNAYYYVPGETIEEMCQLYNGKAIAGGLPLLSEVAALYDFVGTNRYANISVAEFDGMLPKYVIKAGMNLTQKYPIFISHMPLQAPMQFAKMYLGVIKNRKAIADDLKRKVEQWKWKF